jgi:hypothetical protein
MANLNIEMPDDLARGLEEIAAAQHRSIQQLALEQRALIPEIHAGSPEAVLRVTHGPPHPSAADVEELDAVYWLVG